MRYSNDDLSIVAFDEKQEECNSSTAILCVAGLGLIGETLTVPIEQLNRQRLFTYVEGKWIENPVATGYVHIRVERSAECIHKALGLVDSLGSDLIDISVFCLFNDSLREDHELTGAILRASLCHSARVVVLKSEDVTDVGVSSYWISDMVPLISLSSPDEHHFPLWRGELFMADDTSCYAEIYPWSPEGSSLDNGAELFKGAVCMEFTSTVQLSSVHSCYLGEMFRTRLINVTDGTLHSFSENMGCVLRSIYPSEAKAAITKANKIKSNDALAVKTTEQWISYVLRGQLHKPDSRPVGPTHHKYFLLYKSRSSSDFLCLVELNASYLAPVLYQAERQSHSLASISHVFSENTESIYNQVRSDPLSAGGLLKVTEDIKRRLMKHFISEMDSEGWMKRILENATSWPERLALIDYMERKESLTKSSFAVKSDQQLNAGQAALSLASVISKFSASGQSVDPALRLPTGNKETKELLTHSWPSSLFYYGPGISYHSDDEVNHYTNEYSYISHRSFCETSSIYTLPGIEVVNQKTPRTPTRRSTRIKTATCLDRPDVQKMNVPSKTLTSDESSQAINKLTGVSQDNKLKTKQQGEQHELKITKQADEQRELKLSRDEKLERNRKNEMRMKAAVDKALRKHKIKEGDKSYSECYSQLYQVTYAAVKKLKTSHNLEKNMRDIANKFAPLMVATFQEQE